jgi:hypothetical protein
MTYPSKEYEVGSNISINVSVFIKGALEDPAEVSVTFGSDKRVLDLIHVGKGEYKTTTEILPEDLSMYSQLYFTASAVDSEGISNSHLQYMNLQSQFQVSIVVPDPADLYPGPGQTVEFQVITSYMDERVNATMVSTYYGDQLNPMEYLSVVRSRVGIYEGEFTLPPDWNESGRLDLWVRADYKNGTIDVSDSVGLMLHVKTLHIWRQLVRLNETRAALVLHVLDMIDEPASGAAVFLKCTYISERKSVSKEYLATTDERGTAVVIMDFDDMSEDPQETHISISGHVEHLGQQLTFSEKVYVKPLWIREIDVPFKCLDVTEPALYSMGDIAQVEYIAFWEGEVLPDQEITLVIWDNETIRSTEKCHTDEMGRFSLTVPVPWDPIDVVKRPVFIHLWTNYNGTWAVYHDLLVTGWGSTFGHISDNPDPGITLEVGPIEPGGPISVAVDCNLADGVLENALLIWLPQPLAIWERDTYQWNGTLFRPEWKLYQMGRVDSRLMVEPLRWTGERYEGEFFLPSFLDPGTEPFMYASVYSVDWDDQWSRATSAGTKDRPESIEDSVVIDNIPDSPPYAGEMIITGVAVGEDIERVEISLDGGDWTSADGVTRWSYELDADELVSSMHLIAARAISDGLPGPVSYEGFFSDMAPSIIVTQPEEDQVVNTTLSANGSAYDDINVIGVEVRLDTGEWEWINTSMNWTYQFNLSSELPGEHILSARSFDGNRYSDVTHVRFIIEELPKDPEIEEKEDDKGKISHPGAVVVIIALCSVVVLRRGRWL